MGIYNLGGGGGASVLEARTVIPSTSQQIIKPSRDEYDGLSQVTVEATPLETRTVNPSTSSQTITPSGSNIGFSTITVNPYRLQSKNVTPSTNAQTVSPDSGYNGLSSVSVGAVSLQSKTVTPSSSTQYISADSGYYGLSGVSVGAVSLQSKTVTPSSSTQYISADSGYYGLSGVSVGAVKYAVYSTTLDFAAVNFTNTYSVISLPFYTNNIIAFYCSIPLYTSDLFNLEGMFNSSTNNGDGEFLYALFRYSALCSKSDTTITLTYPQFSESLQFNPSVRWTFRYVTLT